MYPEISIYMKLDHRQYPHNGIPDTTNAMNHGGRNNSAFILDGMVTQPHTPGHSVVSIDTFDYFVCFIEVEKKLLRSIPRYSTSFIYYIFVSFSHALK